MDGGVDLLGSEPEQVHGEAFATAPSSVRRRIANAWHLAASDATAGAASQIRWSRFPKGCQEPLHRTDAAINLLCGAVVQPGVVASRRRPFQCCLRRLRCSSLSSAFHNAP